MLIAKLVRYYPFGGDEVLYCAVDPFDDERLTQWFDTISAVDEELVQNTIYGLNTAAYAGESDVPARISEDEVGEPECIGLGTGLPIAFFSS